MRHDNTCIIEVPYQVSSKYAPAFKKYM